MSGQTVQDLFGWESRVLMTVRVSRDAGRTWEQESVVREGDPVVVLASPERFPPCDCTRCLGHRTVRARSLRPTL